MSARPVHTLADSARPIALTYALGGANAPMSSGATFDLSVDVGNILTVATISVSVIVLLMSLAKDRRIREREIADKVRGAAARTLAKLERWQELTSYYENVRPGFEETSRMLATDFDVDRRGTSCGRISKLHASTRFSVFAMKILKLPTSICTRSV